MNPVLTNISERRSVRFFKEKPIDRAVLQKIINAGNMAPSGMNVQNWRLLS